MGDEDDFRKQQYTKVIWSDWEAPFKSLRQSNDDTFFKYCFPFSLALMYYLKRSIFGTFLDVLNPDQDQNTINNKFAILDYEVRQHTDEQRERWLRKNNLFDNMYGCLSYFVTEEVPINMNKMKKIMTMIRLTDFHINKIDIKLRSFSNLQMLNLSGNNIRDLDSSFLPRNLKFLELNDNFLCDVTCLVYDPPRRLIYLGLGRNCLTNNSSLHRLADSGNFLQLYGLDIADNDIYDLDTTLNSLENLPRLRSLLLSGNICYMDPFYIDRVTSKLPKLIYLDNTEILETDRVRINRLDSMTKPCLFFTCYRIMGLPKPPSQFNPRHSQTIHVEITLPLLEKLRTKQEEETIRLSEVPELNELKKKIKNIRTAPSMSQLMKRSSRQSVVTLMGKISFIPKIYEKVVDYDYFIEHQNHAFKSAAKKWSNLIEFPTMRIEIPNDDLMLLRDTLRTKVKIEIIYLLSQKQESNMEMPVLKRSSLKVNSKKSTIKQMNSEDLSNRIILKKAVLASFTCDLETWNWSDESLDFYWLESEEKEGIKVDGSLKNLYGTKNTDVGSMANKLSKAFTCHLGFEMPRDLFSELPLQKSEQNGSISSPKGSKSAKFAKVIS